MFGVIVGVDISQEWLLPWWWENYHRHNAMPVAFFDFGMSFEKVRWCEERGQVIALRNLSVFVKDKEEISATIAAEWEKHYGDNFWSARLAWFKKPLACALAPFENVLWMDLDCEVLGSLSPLVSFCNTASGIALAKDCFSPYSEFPIYNSGVIAFRKHHPLIQTWAEQAFLKNDRFRGDQDLLSFIIAEQKYLIEQLSDSYNWNIGKGNNPQAIVCHWLGEKAKNALRDRLILDQL